MSIYDFIVGTISIMGMMLVVIVTITLLDEVTTPVICEQEYTVMQNVCTSNKDGEVCDVAMMEYYNCTKSKDMVDAKENINAN